MPKVAKIFNDYYDIQESWIRRQIIDFKHDSFIDFDLAKKEIEDAGIAAFANAKTVDEFRDNHLSDIGKKKLSSSLRTYKKRHNRKLTTRRLDIEISKSAYLALELLVNESALTKTQFIEKLILKERKKQINEL